MVDVTQQYLLTACPDSNVYMQPRSQAVALTGRTCASIFQKRYNNIVGDGNSRLFHYYTDSMERIGVSRLRIHNSLTVPKGAVFVTFVSGNDLGYLDPRLSDGKNVFWAARDHLMRKFYPVLCTYKNAAENPPKLFLVRDLDAGLVRLTMPAIESSVTGGAVSKCFFAPIMLLQKSS